MIKVVEFLVFSVVLLFFMAYPAIKITEFLKEKINFSKRVENIILIFNIILLSLIVGGFLKFF